MADKESGDQTSKKRLSKRAQKKLDKSLADKNISEIEKQIILDETLGNNASSGANGVKRQKLDSYRDKKHFISGDREA